MYNVYSCYSDSKDIWQDILITIFAFRMSTIQEIILYSVFTIASNSEII